MRRGSMPIQVTTTVRFKFLSLAASSLFFIPATHAQALDNTANGITADKQSNSASDLAITQKIRKAIVADKL